MAYNLGLEIPEPTGDTAADYQALYEWAINMNNNSSRIFSAISTELAEFQKRLEAAGI